MFICASKRTGAFALAAMAMLLVAMITCCFAPKAQAASFEHEVIETPLGQDAVALSNGKRAFYVEEGTLFRLDMASGALTTVKTLPAADGASWEIGAICKKRVYLTRTLNGTQIQQIMRCKKTGGKLVKVKDNCSIVQSYQGKYLLCTRWLVGTPDAQALTMYKIRGNKLKRLGDVSTAEEFPESL